MQRKKYLPSGLATLALVVYLLRGELNDYMSSSLPETEVLLGETVGLSGVDTLRDAGLTTAGIKDVDRYAEEVFRDIRMLTEYPRTRFDIVSAWLVNGSGSEPSRGSPEGGAATAAAPAANGTAASIPNAVHGESSGGLASELTAEDMDLIDILWRQDMDMGVGRETYDPVLRMEMEKERQLELKKQAEKEAAAAEAKRKVLMSNFTVDPETGELVPLGASDGSGGVDEKAFETGFWSRPHFVSDEPCSYSIDELLGENSSEPAAGSFIQPAAATSLPDQALYDDSFLTQLTFVGSGQDETARPGGLAVAGVPATGSSLAGLPLQAPTASCASHGLQVGPVAAVSDLVQVLPGFWEGMSSGWQHQQQQQLMNASPSADSTTGQAGWLLDCSGSDDDQAYDFAVFSGLEEEEGESKGACASMSAVDASLASIFDNVTAIADLDLDNFDMDCLDMAQGKQNLIDMVDLAPFSSDHDGNSMSSDSAISMDVASTFEDWAESSPESNNSSDYAVDVQPGSSDLSSMSLKSRSKRALSLSTSNAVQHNHTYTAQPGGQPHVRKMDMKKQAQNDTMSRDERSAKELGLPFSVDAVVSAPVDEFNAMMRSYVLTEEQMRLVRDIRRRGKNKVAAQNCRRRKLGALVELGESLESLRERRQAMLDRGAALRHETNVARSKLAVLYDDLFSSLRTHNGMPYESSRFELRLADEATRRLLLVPSTPGPGIGAAALREAIASSTSLLPSATAAGAAASTNVRQRHSAGGSSSSGRARSHASSQK